jgi:hypothetical protein
MENNRNQTTYIGVRGHRGAGKPTISYLLAGTIDWYIRYRSFDESFEEFYKSLVDEILSNPDDFINMRPFDYVYLESFSDTQRVMCSMMLGIDIDHFYNEYSKDHLKVCLDNLEVTDVSEEDDLVTAEDKIAGSEGSLMTLREFCSYFSLGMQSLIGENVWIDSLENSKNMYRDSDSHTLYKVFYDVKMPSEVTYIVERQGYIVRVVRPGRKKRSTSLSSKLDSDTRVDFEVLIDGDDMMSCKEDLKEITQIIVEGKTQID